ncbi:hypothetical protein Syun_029566 [Stephania yunnanensis]|uniref:Uncharacterized protein n=1 Tax=Stephania yunnanensis TaxID=152371 RepID=A0AAP0E968_9MAGN
MELTMHNFLLMDLYFDLSFITLIISFLQLLVDTNSFMATHTKAVDDSQLIL